MKQPLNQSPKQSKPTTSQAKPTTGIVSMIASVVSIDSISRVVKQFVSSDPALYYENVGFDAIENKQTALETDVHKPVWQNCGYWEGQSTYIQACERLTHKVGELAELDTADVALDVGFGFGEQDIYWVKNFAVKKIVGINITPFQVEAAQKRAAAADCGDRIDYQQGDAVQLPIEDASVDRVIALQSAFQFNTRDAFFKEAFRVLKPNGILVLADMIQTDGKTRSLNPWSWFTRRRVAWPHQNVYSATPYRQHLQSQGFSVQMIDSIRESVYTGMREYIGRRYRGERAEDIVIDASAVPSAEKASKLWQFHYGVDDYVLVKAIKPAE